MHSSKDLVRVAEYREKIIDEILYALGFPRHGIMRRALGPLFRYPAGRFGRIIARADDAIRISGLCGGARRIMADLELQASVRGAENIPGDGPLLVVSNHPGAYDSVVIMSCIPRKDLKVILSDVAFTRAFAAARHHFIYAPLDTAGRMAAFRTSLGHLKNGGALLIYAHDEVEPDPDLSPGAMESIGEWSRSIEIMLRAVPNAWLQLTMASGILMSRFLNNPLVRIRRSAPKRQKLAEFFQVSRQMISPRSVRPHPRVSFAAPVKGMDLPQNDMMPTVIAMARRLLADHLASFRQTPR